ncbi:MAG: helix-turn-helix transcriptional regulator [Lachnospiraceae bacterium]|nr:helix-turn-helix transcriptional regulator [Lachnospiraceae bacterium]
MDMYKAPLKECLSDYVLRFRKEQKLSQEKMAELLRMTPRAYGDLERGKFCFSTQTMLFFFSLLETEEMVEIMDEFREIVVKAEKVKTQGNEITYESGNRMV